MPSLRTITSAVAAAALAVSGLAASATPARANDDLVRLLAGATAIVIIAHALRDRDDRRTHRHVQRYQPLPPVALPRHCAIEIRSRDHGRRTYFGADCLRDAGIRTWRLPDRCEATLRTNRGSRTVYDADCLRRAGYTIDRSARGHGRPHRR
jgi:hypothetical protein